MIILLAVLQFLLIALEIYGFVILIYVVMSFIPMDQDNFLVKFIKGLVDPIYNWIETHLPRIRLGMISFTLIYLVVIISVLEYIIRLTIGLILKQIS